MLTLICPEGRSQLRICRIPIECFFGTCPMGEILQERVGGVRRRFGLLRKSMRWGRACARTQVAEVLS